MTDDGTGLSQDETSIRTSSTFTIYIHGSPSLRGIKCDFEHACCSLWCRVCTRFSGRNESRKILTVDSESRAIGALLC